MVCNLPAVAQLYSYPVTSIYLGCYWAELSPAKVYGDKPVVNPEAETWKHIPNSSKELIIWNRCDSAKTYGTQHWKFYGCYVPYIKIHCDIVVDGRAIYTDYEEYINDMSTLKNLIE